MMEFDGVFSYNMVDFCRFDKSFVFQGLEDILEAILGFFELIENAENVDFSMFYRSHYRSE